MHVARGRRRRLSVFCRRWLPAGHKLKRNHRRSQGSVRALHEAQMTSGPGDVVPTVHFENGSGEIGDRDDGEGEHRTAFFEVAAHRDFGVAEGDVGMDPAIEDGPGDGEDVVRTLSLDEGVVRRHYRGGDNVEVVRGQGSDPCENRPVGDSGFGNGLADAEEEILARIEPDHDEPGWEHFLNDHGEAFRWVSGSCRAIVASNGGIGKRPDAYNGGTDIRRFAEEDGFQMASRTARSSRTIDGHELQLTNLGKVMYPDTGLTKQGVIDYYEAIADVLLPQLRDRVVTRIRYPDGTGGMRFFEKNTPSSMPEWIRSHTISASPGTGKKAKQVRYPVIDDLAALIWMANKASLELHTPQWHVGPRGGIGNPDRLVFDLDPGEGTGIRECADVAHIVRQRLAEDGLESVPVTSGSKGIHLYAPLPGNRNAMAVHAYGERIAHELAAAHPEQVVAVIGKPERIGKVMIDWSQNHPARSTATPYTLRGKHTPTVAAPRAWEEIGEDLQQLSPAEVLNRIDTIGDLLALQGVVKTFRGGGSGRER